MATLLASRAISDCPWQPGGGKSRLRLTPEVSRKILLPLSSPSIRPAAAASVRRGLPFSARPLPPAMLPGRGSDHISPPLPQPRLPTVRLQVLAKLMATTDSKELCDSHNEGLALPCACPELPASVRTLMRSLPRKHPSLHSTRLHLGITYPRPPFPDPSSQEPLLALSNFLQSYMFCGRTTAGKTICKLIISLLV